MSRASRVSTLDRRYLNIGDYLEPLFTKYLDETEPTPKSKPRPLATHAKPSRPAPGQKFMDAFGVEKGARWFAEGKSFDEGLALHRAELEAERESLRSKLKKANEEIAMLKALPTMQRVLGRNGLAKFAASIKIKTPASK